MKLRIASLILATALLTGVLGGKGRRTIRVVISRLQPAAVPATAVFSAGARVRTTRIGRVSAAPVAFLRTTTAPDSVVCGAPAPSAVRSEGPGARTLRARSPDYVRPEGRSRPLAVARRRTLLIWSSSNFSPPAKRRYPGHPATERSMYRSRRSTSRRGRERGPLLARYCRSRTRRRPAALSPPATPACRLTRW